MTGWDKIKGHANIKKYLTEALEHQDVFHACLISGADGSGKRTIADTFAAALLCENQTDRQHLRG